MTCKANPKTLATSYMITLEQPVIKLAVDFVRSCWYSHVTTPTALHFLPIQILQLDSKLTKYCRFCSVYRAQERNLGSK